LRRDRQRRCPHRTRSCQCSANPRNKSEFHDLLIPRTQGQEYTAFCLNGGCPPAPSGCRRSASALLAKPGLEHQDGP
jgi:hypothetical protein